MIPPKSRTPPTGTGSPSAGTQRPAGRPCWRPGVSGLVDGCLHLLHQSDPLLEADVDKAKADNIEQDLVAGFKASK